MNKILAGAAVLITLGAGCVAELPSLADVATPDAAPADDFTPSEGASTGPGELGPWVNRLVLATSDDGVTFTSTGTVIGDQMDVPDLIVREDGDIFLYAIAWSAGTRKNALVAAVSDDNGESWNYRYVDIEGLAGAKRSGGPSPADPDAVVLEDGTVRLYFTYDATTHYADSTDGLAFAYGGVAFSASGAPILDPSIVRIDDTWHLYGGGSPEGNWHATSDDGMTFTAESGVRVRSTDGNSYMLSNALAQNGTTRFFGFSNQGTDIHTFTTDDGTTFTSDGVALAYLGERVGESSYVKDASVIALPGGGYLMAYVTRIPE